MVDQTSDRRDLLIEAGLALASELSLPAVLQRIVDLAIQITGARYGALGVLGPDRAIMEFVTIGVSDEQRRAIGHLPVGKGILGALIHDATPLRLPVISEDPRSVGFPPNHPPMRSFLGAPVTARRRVFGNIYLTEKQGAEQFSQEDERALVILASQAGVAIENARLYEDARRNERRLQAVGEVSTRILEGAGPDELLELVASWARDLTGANLAMVAMPLAGTDSLQVRVAVGDRARAVMGLEVPREESISGSVMTEGRIAVLVDAGSEPRAYRPMIDAGDVGPAIFVPLSGQGSPIGTLAVANPAGGKAFGFEDVAVMETFASQAAVALEYAQARRELERLAVMDDRERIAKELHDGVIQSLFAVGMGLQATATLARDPDIDRRIDDAVNQVDRVIRDLRNYIFGLRPGLLADRQLDQALRALAEEFGSRTGVTIAVDIDSPLAADLSSRANDILQIAREALSNVGRHARATTCRLALRRDGGQAVLEIEDDGIGFDPAAAVGSGQGLANLQARASALGGELVIQGAPGDGTAVRVGIPVR